MARRHPTEKSPIEASIMIKIWRLRRVAEEWGNYKIPIQERRYVPFQRRAEPTTIPELHARISGCFKGGVDYQLFDRNYTRWVHGSDVQDLGKKPRKQFPSLTRVYNEKFDKARAVEGLNSQRETVEFLLAEYEAFPPGAESYSSLRLEFPVHLDALKGEVQARKKSVSEWMRDGFPNRFLERRGVKNPAALRRTWGEYAAHKLAPLDHGYAAELTELLRARGRELGREPDARAIARTIQPYLAECALSAAPDLTLVGSYEGALKRNGLEVNGQRRLLELLDAGGPR